MANAITRHIPNTITSCNLFCGCIASYMAFQGSYGLAFLFIVMGAVFDFFDGMSARLLHVSSPLGKELDSLADDVTFGVAPSAMVFSLFHEVTYPEFLMPVAEYMAVHGFSHFRIFSPPSGKIQYRPATKYVVYRTPDTGQYAVLGFADCRCTRFSGV